MPLFEMPKQLSDNAFASNVDLDMNFSAIETLLNGNLDNDNIDAEAEIDARKIGNGGAVTQGEITTTGEANKIPKFTSDGDLVVSRIIFKEGFNN